MKFIFETAKKRIIGNPLWAGYLINVDNQIMRDVLSNICSVERITCAQIQEVFGVIKKRLNKILDDKKEGVVITSITVDPNVKEANAFCIIVGVEIRKA